MRKHWLAVIGDNDLTVARIAVGPNNEMKIKFLSEYKHPGTDNIGVREGLNSEPTEMKNWLLRQKIPLKKLKLAVSSLGLITKVIALPQMSNDDLEKMITNNYDHYFTLNSNVQKYIIDYRILNKYRENERPMLNVLLAAFPKERMQNIWTSCQYLGFEPTVVDLTADCLARIYSTLANNIQVNLSSESEESSSSPGDMVIVSFHADKVEFVLLENGVFFLYSNMEFNTQAISEHYYRNNKQEEAFSSKEEKANKSSEKTELISAQEPSDDELFLGSDAGYSDVLPDINDENNVLEEHKEHKEHEEHEELEELEEPEEIKETEELEDPKETQILENLKIEESSDNFRKRDHFLNELINPLLVEHEQELFEGDEVFKQAALNINSKKENSSEFVLEDLFIPMEKLEGKLAFTINKLVGKDDWPLENEFLGLAGKEEWEKNFEPVLSNLSELLSFFSARHFGHTVNSVYLTGEYCTLPFLSKIFQENFGVQTRVGFPRGWKPQFEGNSKALAAEWQKYGSLYGLALRED